MKNRIIGYLLLISSVSCFVGCETINSRLEIENTPIENEFAEIWDVNIPRHYSIAQGQDLQVMGKGFSVLDTAVLRPVGGGADINPDKVSAGPYNYSLTIPVDIQVGKYSIIINRADGDVVNIGDIDIYSEVVIDALSGDTLTSVQGGVKLTCNPEGTSQFRSGDSIMLVDYITSEIYRLPAGVEVTDPSVLTYSTPADYLGMARTYLIRGSTVSYLQDIRTIDVKLYDYYKGGIIIYFNPEKALSGLLLNLYNGVAIQRSAEETELKRRVMAAEYTDPGSLNGTQTLTAQAIFKGRENTQAFLDYEIARGNDPANIQSTGDVMPMIPYLAQQYSITGKDDGVVYDDWFVPSYKTLEHMVYHRDEINLALDLSGGEALPGSSYTYTTEPNLGEKAWGSGDGMSTASSNMDGRAEYFYNLLGVQFLHDDPESPQVWVSYMVQDQWWAFRLVREF